MPALSTAKRPVPPIRSLVLVSADESLVNKAIDGKADALWLDLEQPRFPFGAREREVARGFISEYMRSIGGNVKTRPLAFLRVSHPSTGETLGDLRAGVTPALAGVLLPKVDTAADVHMLEGLLTAVEHERGIPIGTLQVIPLLESAMGVRSAYEIATASARITYMGGMISAFGDLHRAFGYRWTAKGTETDYLREKVLVDARAAGIRYPISGMWGGATSDIDALTAWARSLRALGYFGMVSSVDIIALVNEIFSPTKDEITYWKKLAAQGEIVSGTAQDPGDYPLPSIPESYIESAHWNLSWARDLGLLSEV